VTRGTPSSWSTFGPAKAYEPRTFLENLATKTDPLQLVTLVHETQREDLADVVPAAIEVEHVFPTEVASLIRVVQ